MNRPIRIVHVETGMNLYGGALQVLYLLQGTSGNSEVKNILVCPDGSDVGSSAENVVSGLYRIPMSGDLDIPFLFRTLSIIKREHPDIVHLHSRRGADTLGGLAAKLTGTRCVLTRRVDNPEFAPLARIKYRLYDRVITISDGIRDVLVEEGVPENRIIKVPSAVDADHYGKAYDREWFQQQFGISEGMITCGVTAQLIHRKGHQYLLEAVPGIVGEVPDARFLLFGKGPLEGKLRGLCDDLGITDKVAFAGFRSDLDRILGCLDLVIHPALMEGLGVSLLQAAAAGVPIVGTRVGGIPEVVVDGVNGILVPPADTDAIVQAAVKLLQDPGLAARMGSEGRRIARERFSIEAMVKGNLEVYREVMGEEIP
jgi:glycosyltransferase involved in cell wall biosynthesis